MVRTLRVRRDSRCQAWGRMRPASASRIGFSSKQTAGSAPSP